MLGINGMVTRKQLTEAIETHVKYLIEGRSAPEPEPAPQAEEVPVGQPQVQRDQSIRGFVPSRGDEPYLYTPQDPELADRCSNVLDGLEYIEQYVWTALERNRA